MADLDVGHKNTPEWACLTGANRTKDNNQSSLKQKRTGIMIPTKKLEVTIVREFFGIEGIAHGVTDVEIASEMSAALVKVVQTLKEDFNITVTLSRQTDTLLGGWKWAKPHFRMTWHAGADKWLLWNTLSRGLNREESAKKTEDEARINLALYK